MELITVPVAVLNITLYTDWWFSINKKTRNMIRKSWKQGIHTVEVNPDLNFWKEVNQIFNEVPERRGKPYRHYGETLHETMKVFEPYKDPSKNVYFGAYYQGKLVAFMHLLHEAGLWKVSALQGYEKHFDKAPMNALIDAMVQFCSQHGIYEVVYGRMQGDGLGVFKRNNGFRMKRVPRFLNNVV